MRTRLVRVRRRPRAMWWAVLFLIAAMILYIRVSLPVLRQMRSGEEEEVDTGARVTREVSIDALETHLISFGTYDAVPSAQIEAARYVSRGAAGYVLEASPGEQEKQIIGAGYDDKSEAQAVCAQLHKSEGIAASVVSLSAPQLTMRMTAGSAQIEAFLEAEQAVRSAALAVGQLSFSLDRGEATALQAGNVIKTHNDKVDGALKSLRAQSAQQSHEMFEGLERLMEDMLDQMKKMQQETGAMALSSRLKYCYIDARVRQIEWMNDLIGS